ncbi:hypothetical protein [Peteryoungia desertarenae]|uniref:hypothetical protein n=1 Tax=Peteryoungia desertarenae TaxID=1813451 RepID=UPI001FE4F278|nr:hypothetical protein [Peteryoungia desertarenae]
MASQIVHFAELSERDRKAVPPLPKLTAGDRLELHLLQEDGRKQTLLIPPQPLRQCKPFWRTCCAVNGSQCWPKMKN